MRPVAFFSISIAALALNACDSPTSYLDSHELSVAARQVASLAGEAQWLAQQLRERSITTHMAWVHQQALGEDAAKVARDLAKPALPPLRDGQDAVAQLDAQLLAQVGRIAPAAEHRDELDALQREFGAIAARARTLGQMS
jgi:hypothetical protein